MSRLFVVRHGQASFGAADYDQLSPLGETQSERLGRFFAEQDIAIGALYVGPHKRHRQTAEGIAKGLASAGANLVAPTLVAGLGELPAFELFQHHREGPLDGRAFGENNSHSFEAVCEAWMHGSIDSGDLENALQFEARVTAALEEIRQLESETRRNSLIVTSGGPTMVVMKTLLDLHASKACELLWVIANASITELRYRKGKLFLTAFNGIPHLQAEHITYR